MSIKSRLSILKVTTGQVKKPTNCGVSFKCVIVFFYFSVVLSTKYTIGLTFSLIGIGKGFLWRVPSSE